MDQDAKSETGNSVCCIFYQGEKRKTDILVNYILDQDEEPKTEFLDWYSLDEGGLDKKETIQIATFWIKMRNQKTILVCCNLDQDGDYKKQTI